MKKHTNAILTARCNCLSFKHHALGVMLHPPLEDDDDSTAVANARRVALCWNTHDDLVAALEKVLGMLVQRGDPFDGDDWQLVQEARAVLARAKGN